MQKTAEKQAAKKITRNYLFLPSTSEGIAKIRQTHVLKHNSEH